MKRMDLLILILAAIFLMTACAQSASTNTYTVTKGDTVFSVDLENGTISDGEIVYQFTVSGNTVEITYPDGSTYWWTFGENVGYGGWSDDYDPDRYMDGNILVDTLEWKAAPQESTGHPFFSILLAALGLWNLISPYSAWYISYGWRYKDAEPSDAALQMTRLGGGFALFLAVLLLFA